MEASVLRRVDRLERNRGNGKTIHDVAKAGPPLDQLCPHFAASQASRLIGEADSTFRLPHHYNASMRWIAMLVTMVLLTGCAKPLFPATAQRSPYERYLALRGLDRPPTETDAFGRQKPALRQRLRPLHQP